MACPRGKIPGEIHEGWRHRRKPLIWRRSWVLKPIRTDLDKSYGDLYINELIELRAVWRSRGRVFEERGREVVCGV